MDHLSLRQLSGLIKAAISVIPDNLWVVAEIANININRQSGHCYLELVEKDNETLVAQIKATIWSRVYGRLSTHFRQTTGRDLEAGMKVLMLMRPTFHEVYGLSVNVIDLDPAYTMGEMALMRKRTIERLTKEGVIDKNRSLSFPLVPKRIAIVSSGTAAGLGDFRHKIEANPFGYGFSLTVFEAFMQGAQAEASLIKALRNILKQRGGFDIVVIIRGGGSQTDLNCFDSYALAREIALFPLPVLTGIGHERDETVSDRVAHKKLTTPTAAADFIVNCAREFELSIDSLAQRLADRTLAVLSEEKTTLSMHTALIDKNVKNYLRVKHNATDALEKDFEHGAMKAIDNASSVLAMRLSAITSITKMFLQSRGHVFSSRAREFEHSAVRAIAEAMYQIRQSDTALERHAGTFVVKHAERLKTIDMKLNLLNPMEILRRGYSITTHNGKTLSDSHGLRRNDIITTRLYNGRVSSSINEIEEDTKDGRQD